VNSVWRGLHLAHTFLTTLPFPHVGEIKDGEFANASGYYPAVGWTLGLLLALMVLLTSSLPNGVAAALQLALWLALTGMLHFDGLVDASDAVLATKTPSERLKILSDVHIGAFGLAVGVMQLLTKWSALSAQPNLLAIVTTPVLARAALLIPMNLFPAARAESLGARAREGNWQIGLLIAVPAILLNPKGAIVAVITALIVSSFAARKLGGGIGGDVYGSVVELCETTILIAAFV
jgi:adenosylcobinamide-GDP ribazoletransferase